MADATNAAPDLELEEAPPARAGWRSADLARAAVIALSIWFGLQLLWFVNSLVFLLFLATLFGLAVGRGVDYLERFKIRRGIGSALIVFGTLGVIYGGLRLSAPTLIEQGKELQAQFPEAVTKVQTWVDSKQRTGATGALIKAATQETSPTVVDSTQPVRPSAKAVKPPPPKRPSEVIREKLTDGLAKASGYLFSFVSSTLAVLAAFVLLVFLAIYIGAEPEVYRGWMLAAVPAGSRPHVRRVLTEMSTVLRKWLVTQMVAMIAIGSVSTVVLLLLGVKAPFALGFIAGLMEFIPTVGPVLAAVPAVLMGFADSPEKALFVVIAYWGIQFIENNLLIPFLMRGEMDLPPAITLIAQALMTLVFGFLGLMVAVPLTAAVLVPLRMRAERENAKEREMARARHRAKDAEEPSKIIRVTAAHALTRADRGPAAGDLSEDD